MPFTEIVSEFKINKADIVIIDSSYDFPDRRVDNTTSLIMVITDCWKYDLRNANGI